MECFLDNEEKKENCFGCEACAQICPKNAITMVEDEEGFRYPKINKKKCIKCGLCRKICPYINMPEKSKEKKYTFGGSHKNIEIRDKSTSGGAFSAIVDSFCDKNYVIFGAASDGIKIYHTYIDNKEKINLFRKSKYNQSIIGNSYKEVKDFLKEGKKVLFSGTPCQIAGLKSYLNSVDITNLLLVEVVCEGVPSPHYFNKLNKHLKDKYGGSIKELDYRYKDSFIKKGKHHAKWDFQVMYIMLDNGIVLKKDRWLNPFWQLWLNHLMSRPSCYNCKFTTSERIADITLGDLWGVHLYCPDLYHNNTGSSLVVCNTQKGKEIFKKAQKYLDGRELKFEDALKYQSPMRKSIEKNENRQSFMEDLKNENISYNDLIKKWYKKPTIKLLYSKYIWGNRQKVALWEKKNKGSEKND